MGRMRDDTPDELRRVRLGTIFDEDPELYDRARPGYPPEVFDDLDALGGTWPGCRVLEVGAGTGKATVPLAGRGCRITAVEPGPGMAGVARRNLAAFPAVEVVTAAFESWPLPAEPFDAVVCATAFHWIDPAVRTVKAADALRPGGVLAVIATQHVAGGTEDFFAEVQGCYERFDPATPPGLRPPAAADVDTSDHTAEIARSGRFRPVVRRRHEWELAYTTAQYLDLLRTYSGHRSLPPASRDGLLACVAGLIDTRYGGRVTKRYLTELRVSAAR